MPRLGTFYRIFPFQQSVDQKKTETQQCRQAEADQEDVSGSIHKKSFRQQIDQIVLFGIQQPLVVIEENVMKPNEGLIKITSYQHGGHCQSENAATHHPGHLSDKINSLPPSLPAQHPDSKEHQKCGDSCQPAEVQTTQEQPAAIC